MTAPGSTQFRWLPEHIEKIRSGIAQGKTSGQLVAEFAASGITLTREQVKGAARTNGLSFGSIKGPGIPLQAQLRKKQAGDPPAEPAGEPAGFDLFAIRSVGMVSLFNEAGSVVFPPLDVCRWIEGDIRTGTAVICPEKAKAGSQFCPHHHLRAWNKAPKREQGSQREFVLFDPRKAKA